jgi:Archaeal flagellins
MKKTPTNQVRSSEEGLAGVAALIIFIAIVLVGAITAAVILDVSGSLEQQAAQTGEDASNQISSTLQVLDKTGFVGTTTTDGFDNISFVTTVAPGTPALDLNSTIITLTGDENRYDLVSEDTFDASGGASADPGDGIFKVSDIDPTGGTDSVIGGPEERVVVEIPSNSDPAEGSGGDGKAPSDLDFQQNQRFEVTFTAGPGGQAFQEIRVPATLTEGGVVSL